MSKAHKEGSFAKYGGLKAWRVTGIDSGSTSINSQRVLARGILEKRGNKVKTFLSLGSLPFVGAAAIGTDINLLANAGMHLLTNTSPDVVSGLEAGLACGATAAVPALAIVAARSAWNWGKSYFETKSAAVQAAEEDRSAKNSLVRKYLRASHFSTIDYVGTGIIFGLGIAANAIPVVGQVAGPIIAVGGSFGYSLLIDAIQAGAKKHMYDDARSYIVNTKENRQPQQRRRRGR